MEGSVSGLLLYAAGLAVLSLFVLEGLVREEAE